MLSYFEEAIHFILTFINELFSIGACNASMEKPTHRNIFLFIGYASGVYCARYLHVNHECAVQTLCTNEAKEEERKKEKKKRTENKQKFDNM